MDVESQRYGLGHWCMGMQQMRIEAGNVVEYRERVPSSEMLR